LGWLGRMYSQKQAAEKPTCGGGRWGRGSSKSQMAFLALTWIAVNSLNGMQVTSLQQGW
jgi:hypothetical protein